jgi:hypothetical protein
MKTLEVETLLMDAEDAKAAAIGDLPDIGEEPGADAYAVFAEYQADSRTTLLVANRRRPARPGAVAAIRVARFRNRPPGNVTSGSWPSGDRAAGRHAGDSTGSELADTAGSPVGSARGDACGVMGPLMLAAYFAASLFAPPLGRLVYAAHPPTAEVVDIDPGITSCCTPDADISAFMTPLGWISLPDGLAG